MIWGIADILWQAAWLAFLARQAGGGDAGMWLVYQVGTRWGSWWGSAASRFPEFLFALHFAVTAYERTGSIACAAGVLLTTYAAMELGHGNFMADGVAEHDFPDRASSLEKWTGLHWLLPRLGLAARSKWYSRILMALKGGLIGAGLGWWALLLAPLWALAYALCFQPQKHKPPMQRSSEIAEWISGAFAGVVNGLARAG